MSRVRRETGGFGKSLVLRAKSQGAPDGWDQGASAFSSPSQSGDADQTSVSQVENRCELLLSWGEEGMREEQTWKGSIGEASRRKGAGERG